MGHTSVDQGQERVFCLLLVVQDAGRHINDLEHLPFLVVHEELLEFYLDVPLLLLIVALIENHENLVLEDFLGQHSEIQNAELISWPLLFHVGGSILLGVVFA